MAQDPNHDRAERLADASDRASMEEQSAMDNALVRHRLNTSHTIPTPQPDGLCVCGCGEEVEPQRLKIGLGLTLECARRRERGLK